MTKTIVAFIVTFILCNALISFGEYIGRYYAEQEIRNEYLNITRTEYTILIAYDEIMENEQVGYISDTYVSSKHTCGIQIAGIAENHADTGEMIKVMTYGIIDYTR